MAHREMLPLLTPENPCSGCTGACCRKGLTIVLTDSEKQFLVENGADLELTNLASSKNDHGEVERRYFLYKDCPFLKASLGETAVCSTYQDPRKPGICNDFEAGSESCDRIKETRYQPRPTHPPTIYDFMM